MVLSYITSFLGMLSLQWALRNSNNIWAIILAVILGGVGLVKMWFVLDDLNAKKKQMIICYGIHAVIWIGGALFYEFFLGATMVILMIIVVGIFFNGNSSEESTQQQTRQPSANDLTRMPTIVYDDTNSRWTKRGMRGSEAVYCNDAGVEITIYSGTVSGNTANTSAGQFHW